MTNLIAVFLAGVLGIAGALLGSLVASRSAREVAHGDAERARREVQRQEFRVAVTQLCTALVEYRSAELDRWDTRHGGPRDLQTVTQRVYAARTSTVDALYRVQLASASGEIERAIERAYLAVKALSGAVTDGELALQREETDTVIRQIILLARDALGVQRELV